MYLLESAKYTLKGNHTIYAWNTFSVLLYITLHIKNRTDKNRKINCDLL